MAARYGVEFVGPGSAKDYMITVYGYRIPNVRAFLEPGTEDMWRLELQRHGATYLVTEPIPDEWVRVMAGFLAHAMACAAGYSSFGENSQPMNPYAGRMVGITDPR
jgi:hypothetical protein